MVETTGSRTRFNIIGALNLQRIEALLMVMTDCLMVYAALEHKIRHELKQSMPFFPDMKNKPTQSPTAR